MPDMPDSKTVIISVDMEQDCPPFMNSHRGVEQGTPKLLHLFKDQGIKATFFCTGRVAQKYPDMIKKIVSAGHELGCHGNTHRVFSQLSRAEAHEEIKTSALILRNFTDVISFRAPNLSFPEHFLPILSGHGFTIDSSLALYKPAFFNRTPKSLLQRIPVSVTSSVLRLPGWIKYPYLSIFSSPVVLFVHPWEFVDLRKENLRYDCRFNTGDIALACLEEVIRHFKKQYAEFRIIKDCLE